MYNLFTCTASAARLPLLNPYEQKGANFRHGINFAVAGSTALPVKTLASKNIHGAPTNSSLDVQLRRMSNYLSSYCNAETGTEINNFCKLWPQYTHWSKFNGLCSRLQG